MFILGYVNKEKVFYDLNVKVLFELIKEIDFRLKLALEVPETGNEK